MLLQARKQFIEFIAFYDEGKFVGLSYVISEGSLTYIFYLAVDPSLRGHGYGSQILHDLYQMYSGQRICLSAERPDEKADNAVQRAKRIEFYQKNGFVLTDKVSLEQGVEYAMLYHGKNFTEQEYQDLISFFAGIFRVVFKTKFI